MIQDDMRSREELLAEINRLRRRLATIELTAPLDPTSHADDAPAAETGAPSPTRDPTDTEARLRQSQERFLQVVEQMPVMLDAFDEHGKIIFWNRECERVTGYATHEIVDHPDGLKLLYPDDAYRRYVLETIEQHAFQFRDLEFELTCKDGSKRVIAWSNVSQRSPIPGWHTWAIGVDVTERRRAERALRESEGRFQTFMNHSPATAYVKDDQGRLIYANLAFERAFSLQQDSWQGKTDHDLWPAETADRIRENDARIFASGVAEAVEETLPQHDGTHHWLVFKFPFRDAAGRRLLGGMGLDLTERKQADQTILASELKYRQLYENSLDGIVSTDINGVFLQCNEAYERMLGYAIDELRQLNYVELTPERWHAWESEIVRDRIIGRGYSGLYEKEYIRKDGTVFPVELTAHLIRNEAGEPTGMWAFVRDITERKRTEHALRESHALLQALMDHMPDEIYFKDTHHRFTRINLAQARLLGLNDPAEAIGKDDSHFFTREHVEHSHERERRIIETAEPLVDYQQEDSLVDGRSRWVSITQAPIFDDRGRVTSLVGISRDITDRRRAEQALRESEAQFRALAETSPAAICIHRGGPLCYVNTMAEEVFGWPREKLLQIDFWELAHPDHREMIRRRGTERHRGEDPPAQYEIKLLTLDGRVKWIDMRATRIEYQGQVAVLVNAFDVTDRKQAEEEHRRLLAQVQQAQKLESLGVLAGGIAHDFNNLLTGILGSADLAMLELPQSHPVQDNLSEIMTASRRAADLCRQMLAYSGKGRFIVEGIDLNALVEEMTQLMSASVSQRAVIRYDFARDLPAVEADATQIRQVVMNLITNAAEAIGDQSGVITIATGVHELNRQDLDNTLLADDLPEGEYVYLQVTDTGCGMDEETLSRIFDPFFTTKFTGRGLGLAAVMGIIRGHRGALTVDSQPGQGTTFRMMLPALSERAPALKDPAASDGGWRGQGTVLLVDDERSVRIVGKRMLQRMGFDVSLADSGDKAIEILRTGADRIACVVLDLTMPGMSGEETFRELRKIRPDLQIVLSSGYNQEEVLSRFSDQDVAGFVQKPYQSSQMLAVIRQALAS